MTLKIGLVDQVGWEGGRLYIEQLARCLEYLPSNERPNIYWFGNERRLHSSLASVTRFVIERPVFQATQRFESLIEIAKKSRQLNLDFVYPFPGRLSKCGGSAYWIPDFQHLRLPKLFSNFHRMKRDFSFRIFSNIAPRLVVSSGSALQDLRFWQANIVEKTRILRFCTPFSSNDVDLDSTETLAIFSRIPDKFAYVPNQMWRHKDHPTVLRAIAQLRRDDRIDIPVVFSGERVDNRHPEWSQYVDSLTKELGLDKQVFYIGHVNRASQLAVLRNSQVVIQPSLFEGWSTVVEDARALGQRIILSNIAPNIEQSPANGDYFEAGNSLSLANELRVVWTLPPLRPSLDEIERATMARAIDVGRVFMAIAKETIRK